MPLAVSVNSAVGETYADQLAANTRCPQERSKISRERPTPMLWCDARRRARCNDGTVARQGSEDLKALRFTSVPILFLAALTPSFAQTTEQLLAQPPEKLAALGNDPHIAKAMKFLQASDSLGAVLQKADALVDRVVLEETRSHPGQTAQFWNGFRANVRAQIQSETNDFLLMSAQLYAAAFHRCRARPADRFLFQWRRRQIFPHAGSSSTIRNRNWPRPGATSSRPRFWKRCMPR